MDNFYSQLIIHERNLSKLTAYFEEQFEQINMNSIFEAKKFKTETTFKKTIVLIKSDHMKSITSLARNPSDITSKKPSLSSENLNAIIMKYIFQQSGGRSPQFTKHLSS